MIGFVYDAIVDHILAPQADESLDHSAEPGGFDRRAYLDPDAAPIDVEAQELDVLSLDSRVLSVEIGGATEWEHRVAVSLDVQHGDAAESRRRRDAILADLVLRWLEVRGEIVSLVDDVTGQEIETITPRMDYRPLGTSNTNETVTVTFVVTARLPG